MVGLKKVVEVSKIGTEIVPLNVWKGGGYKEDEKCRSLASPSTEERNREKGEESGKKLTTGTKGVKNHGW